MTMQRAVRATWAAVTTLPPARIAAAVAVAVIPGGLVVPLCYAGYIALRKRFGPEEET